VLTNWGGQGASSSRLWGAWRLAYASKNQLPYISCWQAQSMPAACLFGVSVVLIDVFYPLSMPWPGGFNTVVLLHHCHLAVCEGSPPASLLNGAGTWPSSCAGKTHVEGCCKAVCSSYGSARITCGSNGWMLDSFVGGCSTTPGGVATKQHACACMSVCTVVRTKAPNVHCPLALRSLQAAATAASIWSTVS